jgi:hypothetical protein
VQDFARGWKGVIENGVEESFRFAWKWLGPNVFEKCV